MTRIFNYPQTTIEMFPGDIIYSSLGLSTYFAGHTVIIGTDYIAYEVIPGNPGWHKLSLQQHRNRHRSGDKLTILRSPNGAEKAAQWIIENIGKFKTYHLANYDIQNLAKSYCYKFVAQAFYHGADISIVKNPKRLLLPNDIKKSPQLEKIALINIH